MTNPAPVDSNQPRESCSEREAAGTAVHDSGSADDGTSGRIVAVNSSVDPEQIQRSASCQREVDQLVADLIAKSIRLERLMKTFQDSVIPLKISDQMRFRLMSAGGYLTSLWTRNECEK